MHDGRARSIEEAILWHGGEASNAKNKFMQLSKTDRNAVIRFLRSL
ncbi:MAG: di-heme oxidoredictase family protein [Flavipsychrobacter sp.]